MYKSDRDALLLTPGPLTTTLRTKQAMLHDVGSWDTTFNSVTANVCSELLKIAHGEETHVCIPLQGSGTFSVEAAIGTLVPRNGKVLVPDNGAYCARILKILRYLGRESVELSFQENQAVSAQAVAVALDRDPGITHVALVHCETGAGILNPLEEVAEVVKAKGRRLIVDAMSSFGAIEINVKQLSIDGLVAASGKCLEGVPGMGFVIANQSSLESSAGNSHSLALDLYDQWQYMQKAGQWRFTPPTHVVLALQEAIAQFNEEGGALARLQRYTNNCKTLISSMATLGLKPFLEVPSQAPIIVTFHAPESSSYDFRSFYLAVREQGFILYPGKLTQTETFRVGCIGAITSTDIDKAVNAIASTLRSMKVID
jgi:2-aminoethylphosphonate-pyruvate transaminase